MWGETGISCPLGSDEGEMGIGRRGVRVLEEGKEWTLPSLLYADYLVLCSELEEELTAMMECSVEVYKRGLKVNTFKSKVMVLKREEVECEIHLEHVLEFNYLGCVLDE